jgi:hypothetical protein
MVRAPQESEWRLPVNHAGSTRLKRANFFLIWVTVSLMV